MKKIINHIVFLFWFFFLFSLSVFAQDSVSHSPAEDSLRITHQADSLKQRLSAKKEKFSAKTDTLKNKITSPVDTVNVELAGLRRGLQNKIDSLKGKGQSIDKYQQRLDSINTLATAPNTQYQKAIAFEQELKEDLQEKVPGLDKASEINNQAKEKINAVNEVSTELGIGPLGEDIKPHLPSLPQTENLPGLPSDLQTTTPQINGISKPSVSTELPKNSMPDVKTQARSVDTKQLEIPDEVAKVREQIGEIGSTAKDAGAVLKESESYAKEVSKIQEEGIGRSEKLDEIAAQQVQKVDGISTLQEQQMQMDQYKELIEQYKKEKAIEEEMMEKSKEIANDVILQNQAKVDGSVKKMSKVKRKYSDIPDIRNLSKRPPNPMKGLSWRKRVVPGFTLQTLSGEQVWLQLDPQVHYKLNGNLSVGAGMMYRFALDPGKISFSDFGALSGFKAFAQYHAFKGFHIRAEGQQLNWKPWFPFNLDPERRDDVMVAALGIVKSYNITKMIKGNMQALYHLHWGASDPYKPKVMVRLGFDFSLEKKEKKPWMKKYMEMKKKGGE